MLSELIDWDILCNIQKMAEYARTCTTTKNSIDIARKLGISVNFEPLKDDTKAFVIRSGKFQSIYINDSLCNYSKKILCAHELGHLFIEKGDIVELFDSGIEPLNEFKANLFLMYLMPHIFGEIDVNSFHTINEFNQYIENKVV